MKDRCKCGSYAINLHLHGRDLTDTESCDVCFWRHRAEDRENEIVRLRADRDCEKRMRKDSDDLATDLRLALHAILDNPADTSLAHAVLKRIHGVSQ